MPVADAPPQPAQAHARAGRRCASPANWLQLIRFATVGASGYVVNLAVFTLAVHGAGFGYCVAATLAFIVALANNFVWNRRVDVPRAATGTRASRRRASASCRSWRSASTSSCCTRSSSWLGVAEVPGAGDRDRRRDAAELHRQQALELQDVTARGVLRRGRVALLATPPAPAPGADASDDRRGGLPTRCRAAPVAPTRSRARAARRPAAGPQTAGARRSARSPTRLDAVRRERRRYPGSTREVFLKGADRWQVSYFAKTPPGEPRKEIAQVLDRRPQRARCSRRGPTTRSPWTMARGYAGRVRARSSTRRSSGSRSRCCSSCRSCTRGGRGGCCTSTCSCSARSRSRSRSSTRREIDVVGAARLSAAALPAGAHAVDRAAPRATPRRRAPAAAAARAR